MHIETDIYDDNDNFIYRRIISESGQALNITGLQEQTHYNVRSRKIDNNLVSQYSYADFTTIASDLKDDFLDHDWTMWNGKTSMIGSGLNITSQEGNNYLSIFSDNGSHYPEWYSDHKFGYGIYFETSKNTYLKRLEGNYLSSFGTNFKLAYACVLKFTQIQNNRSFAINYSYRKTSGIVNGQFFFFISTNASGHIKLNFQMIDNTTALTPSVLEISHQTSISLNTIDKFGIGIVVDLQNSQFYFIVNDFSTNSYLINTSAAIFYTTISAFKTAGGVANIDNWNETGKDSIVTGAHTDYIMYREALKKDFSETAEEMKNKIVTDFERMLLS